MDVLFIELLLENIMFIGLYRICVYVGHVFVCEQENSNESHGIYSRVAFIIIIVTCIVVTSVAKI